MKNPEINQFNLNSGLLAKYKGTIYSNATWHKIEVENASKLERDAILRTIMNFVHPLDFIPVCYELKDSIVSFLLKNCGAAIERLCRHNLIVANPQDPLMPFKIKIILNFAFATDLKINIQNNITSILNKRFNSETGVLNLEMFYKDPDLIEFYTLSQPKLMFYILHLSRSDNRANQPKSIKLSGNEIEVLKPLEALFGLKTLTSLDLRNNNIKEIDASHFKDLPITELWLDGNPLCDDYDEFTYPKAIKGMIPTLERLDGIYIQNKGMMPFRRNFLCSTAGYDLVDQFLEHYFNLYDTRNRTLLEGIYHKDAMFSLTANYLALQSTSLNAKLTPYKKVSRNLKMMSDFSKNDECLFRGRYAVVLVLTSLPATEHDPYTFTVDLMSYTKLTAVLVVTGVFREAPENLLDPDRVLGFSRMFVLLAGPNDEYSIVNEQLHVYNATSMQAIRSFKQTRVMRQVNIQIPPPQSIKEQVMLAETLVSFTGLTIDWATKCLEECQYDLKRSLELFVDLFKLDKIPSDAFRSVPCVEEMPLKALTPLSERPTPKSTATVSHPLIADISAQDYIQPVQNNRILVAKEEQNSHVPQLACSSKNVTKKENRRREDPKDVCKNNNDVSDEGETINLIDDECVIVEKQPTETGPLLALSSFCKVSPYGIFDEYEPFMSPKVVDGVVQPKKVTKPEATDLWPIACRLEGFKEKYIALKKKCQEHPNGYRQSLVLAMEIVRCYSYHVVTYQVLLLWYFPRHKPVAREFCKDVYYYINANKARCISPRLFDTLSAECECVIGNTPLGRQRFKDLITEFPKQLDAVKGYLRHICGHKGSAAEAKDFIGWVMQVPRIDKAGVRKIVKEFEDMFKIEIVMES